MAKQGAFDAPNGTLSLGGDLGLSGGVFDARGGTVLFDGGGEQVIEGGVTLNNVVVSEGTSLVTSSQVQVNGTLEINGVTRETRAISGSGPIPFGLADATVEVTEPGLTHLQVERRDENHPQAPPSVQTGRYWRFSAAGNKVI